MPEGHEGGEGNTTFIIVTREGNETGPPVAGAIVSLLYEPHTDPGLAEEGGGGNGTDPGPPAGHSHRMVVLATDENGTATFHVNPDHDVTVTATRGSDWRREHQRFVTPGGDDEVRVIPLFRTRVELHLGHDFAPGTIEPTVITPLGPETGTWFPQRILFHSDPWADREYRARIVSLDVRMSWDQTLPDYADLGLGVGNDSKAPPNAYAGSGFPSVLLPGHGIDERVPYEDKPIGGEVPDPGRDNSRQILLIGPGTLSQIRSGDGIFVGPATQAPLVVPDGLHVDIEVVAFFDLTPEVLEQGCCDTPGPGVGLVVAALLLVATAARLAARRDE